MTNEEIKEMRRRLGVGVSDLIPAQTAPLTQEKISDLAMLERWRAHRTGLAPYYPLLYSLVIGMGAQRVFEFGTGESTAVLLSALKQTGGHLVSCSPDIPPADAAPTTGATRNPQWTAHVGLSSEALTRLGPEHVFDLVLHDGSHSAEVVAADLVGILPRVRNGGLVLVHDMLHSYVGVEMGKGIQRAQDQVWNSSVRRITLPFAFGLTLLQVSNENAPVSIGSDKPSSPHRTLRWGENL